MGGFDIAIAGCGIGGLAAALLLARQGHSITLYERFEQPRPLGSGLLIQPTGLAVLDRLGLARDIVDQGARIVQLYGQNPSGEAVLDARYCDLGVPGAFGIGIHRASLFEALHEAAMTAGISIRTGSEVIGSECGTDGRRLLLASSVTSPVHDLVVDALGVATPFGTPMCGWLPYGALWATLEWPAGGPFREDQLEQRYDKARRMAGVLPTGHRRGRRGRELALFWSLRADELETWRTRGLAFWKAEVTALWPECAALLETVVEPSQLAFARYAHRSLSSPTDERLIHIGDAWHSASPQLGQGANMALLDAWALAEGLASDGPLDRRLSRAVALRRGHVRLYQWLTAAFTPLYQSDAVLPALLRDLVLAPLSRFGPGPRIQATMVAGLAGAPLERLRLALPDYPGLRL
jgi:salicylate hydroxylase